MKLEKSKEILSTEGLTEKQIGMIENGDFPIYAKAGAGTGKTEVLTRKILHLVETEQIGLDHLAVITFTNKATAELKGRLSKLLYAKWRQSLEQNDSRSDFYRIQVDQVSMTNISTIHGFCSSLLKKFGLYIGLSPEFMVSSVNGYTSKVIQQKIDHSLTDPIVKNISGNKIVLLVREFLRYCDTHAIRIDDQMIADCQYSKDIPFWLTFKSWFLKLIQEIQSDVSGYKEEHSILTVDDLIQKTAELFSNERLCRQICEKYSVVFMDEFQDSDPRQFYIINQMIENGARVFLVGDDQQAIYSFRGADVESSYKMYDTIKKKDNARGEWNLVENFRSDTKLIRTFNKIFRNHFSYHGEPLSFPYLSLCAPADKSQSGSKVFQMVYNEPVNETVERIISQSEQDGQKLTYNDITILCRRNFEVAACAEKLKAAGIPTQVIGGKGFYESKEIVDVYKLLKAALIGAPLLQTELQYTDYYQFMNEEQLKGLLFELRIIAKEQSLQELLYYICETTGIEEYYTKSLRYQSIANLYKLRDMARGPSGEIMQPLEFLEFLGRMISTKQEEDEAEIDLNTAGKGVVSIYTIHRAKGLAFNIVIFSYADTNLIRNNIQPKFIFRDKQLGFQAAFLGATTHPLPEDPDYTDMTEQAILRYLEEELRIVYVCLTRARHRVVVSCNRDKQKFEELIPLEDYVSPAKWIKQATLK